MREGPLSNHGHHRPGNRERQLATRLAVRVRLEQWPDCRDFRFREATQPCISNSLTRSSFRQWRARAVCGSFPDALLEENGFEPPGPFFPALLGAFERHFSVELVRP